MIATMSTGGDTTTAAGIGIGTTTGGARGTVQTRVVIERLVTMIGKVDAITATMMTGTTAEEMTMGEEGKEKGGGVQRAGATTEAAAVEVIVTAGAVLGAAAMTEMIVETAEGITIGEEAAVAVLVALRGVALVLTTGIQGVGAEAATTAEAEAPAYVALLAVRAGRAAGAKVMTEVGAKNLKGVVGGVA